MIVHKLFVNNLLHSWCPSICLAILISTRQFDTFPQRHYRTSPPPGRPWFPCPWKISNIFCPNGASLSLLCITNLILADTTPVTHLMERNSTKRWTKTDWYFNPFHQARVSMIFPLNNISLFHTLFHISPSPPSLSLSSLMPILFSRQHHFLVSSSACLHMEQEGEQRK